jgi:predicted nucleic acid-binding protein
MRVISDSSPLIYLVKIGCIKYLKNLFDEIIISKGVYEEILEGRKHGKNETIILEELIEEEFIIVKEPNSIIGIETLDRGEKESISICKELNINTILIDEEKGFNISYMFNLNPIRTTNLLIILLDKSLINLSQYRELLKKLVEEGYFLDFRTYEKLIIIGESIAKNRLLK